MFIYNFFIKWYSVPEMRILSTLLIKDHGSTLTHITQIQVYTNENHS